MHELERGQWISCDADSGMYKIGTKLMEIGLSARQNTPIAAIAMPFLNELRAITNETIALSLRVDNERIFIEEIQSNRELRYIAPLGKRLPLWAGAVGKVILSFFKETEKKQYFEELKQKGLLKLPSGKVVKLKELQAEINQIQKDGYDISVGDRDPNTFGIASPIFNHNDEVIGAVGIIGPNERLNKEVIGPYCSLIKKAANDINTKMGSNIRFSI